MTTNEVISQFCYRTQQDRRDFELCPQVTTGERREPYWVRERDREREKEREILNIIDRYCPGLHFIKELTRRLGGKYFCKKHNPASVPSVNV